MGRVLLVVVGLLSVGCRVCEKAGDLCCSESRCENGLACSHDVCVPAKPLTDIGTSCVEGDECQSGLCTASRDCSEPCGSDSDCIPGWSCSLDVTTARLCECHTTPEVCDGKDNDCDGIVDGAKAETVCAMAGPATCSGAACLCTGTLCGGVCVDLDTDPAHCGACGNVCPTGAGVTLCSAGSCVEREVIQPGAVHSRFGIAATATDVYWSDGQQICQTTLADKRVVYFAMGSVPDDLAWLGLLTTGITVQGNTLFWPGIEAKALSGGRVSSYDVPNSLSDPYAYAVNSTRVFWLDTKRQGLYAQLRNGGTPEQRAPGDPSLPQYPATLAADEANVYWIDQLGDLLAQPVEGGTVTTLVANVNPSAFTRLAVDNDALYWTANGNYPRAFVRDLTGAQTGQVMKVSKTGGTPITLADSAPRSLLYAEPVVDGTFVYWTVLDSFGQRSSIMRVPKAGGTAEGLLSVPYMGVTDFTLDPAGIDYISYSDTEKGVFRLPR